MNNSPTKNSDQNKIDKGLAVLYQNTSHVLKEMRVEADLSQKKLARLIGVNQSVISRAERPGTVDLPLSTIYRIANALNYDVEIGFVERETEENQE